MSAVCLLGSRHAVDLVSLPRLFFMRSLHAGRVNRIDMKTGYVAGVNARS